jgi:hypothetical protein
MPGVKKEKDVYKQVEWSGVDRDEPKGESMGRAR